MQQEEPHILEKRFRVSKRLPKHPSIDDNRRDSNHFHSAVIVSLLIMISTTFAFQKQEIEPAVFSEVETRIEIQDIPETEQVKTPPPPEAPAVPIESEDEELLDDITIDETDIDFMEFEELPPPPNVEESDEDEVPPFLPIQNQPKLIGGLAKIYEILKYPEMAIQAGIEGTVAIQLLITKEGVPTEFTILKSLHKVCDEAAVTALKQMRYKPATQREQPVPYRIVQTINFKLK